MVTVRVEGVPADTFGMANISKPFAALAVLMLVVSVVSFVTSGVLSGGLMLLAAVLTGWLAWHRGNNPDNKKTGGKPAARKSTPRKR